MRRYLPSLIALQCFEAAARHLSFTKAGEELYLTQSAVSRQIKNLEAFLGCTLFQRVKQRVQLTPTGETYAKGVRALLDQAEVLTREVSAGQASVIKLAAEPAVASRWLIPRLTQFKSAYPDIAIEVVTDMEKIYGEAHSYDLAILYGAGRWQGLQARFLMADELVAVAAPAVLGKQKAVAAYADITQFPLLHHTAQMSASDEWLLRAGYSVEAVKALPGQRFEHFHLLSQAALQGLGVAILPRYFAKEELENGRLVYACEQSLLSQEGYYVVVPKEKSELVTISRVADWFVAQGSSPAPNS
ncbi:LysR substrate-binding domain-containing protein [Dasania sp. GY-MA-18]|uniref:LysR substrate-binding domain-containing protein n=1 Tax=Dasania phycosphaerae TaxID=2950436 RepID=A0A9J6RMI4_9GAMM|nr:MULTISPECIES: LysR substrate-binding domain-containing protein [Dasania]MCR8922969.1 LysR substrate-binding domain-containing protein [Dasania sp. GY-MA-18]MCZ0865400.1 LysR substrate-binding domain-containing protein [Dasania phycosphaerae]MCZ0869125.1 LysR substrate-binding domain-containing protein [Dasania phycosphaerae]